PESVVRAANYGMPLMLAIIGGDPRRFRPYVELFHRALAQRDLAPLPVGIHSHGYVADSDAQARDEMYGPWREMRDRIGAERGWPPTSRADFDREADHGSVYVGSPETVARRIAATVQAMGAARFDMKYSAGTLSHEKMMRCIELFGREVAPRVRALLAS
ncbi:MAG TPA: LLM class flavin-dependent oxidoreductase, partial [Gemmatimonadaceae bacterium]|nr:LLM class flavin-dependent oxidoreductase [Gemmatimonadaceae bacterium]